MEKIGNWFLSKTGRNISSYFTVSATLGGFLAYIIPQGICIDQLKSVVQMYQDGLPKEVSPEILKRAIEVLNETQLNEREREQIKFFTPYGLDMYSAGSVQTNGGGIVGIPETFNYKSRADVNRVNIQLRDTPQIPWGSEAGIAFQESMVLSEKAQKFAIAREINISSMPRPYAYGTLASAAILFTTTISRMGNNKYQLYTRPRKLRLTWYTITCTVGITTFLALKDVLTLYFENKADKKTAKLGQTYLEGGIEFYEKIMQRNKAVRSLMGKYGEKAYTAGGNDNTMFRMPHVPFSARLDGLKKMREIEK